MPVWTEGAERGICQSRDPRWTEGAEWGICQSRDPRPRVVRCCGTCQHWQPPPDLAEREEAPGYGFCAVEDEWQAHLEEERACGAYRRVEDEEQSVFSFSGEN